MAISSKKPFETNSTEANSLGALAFLQNTDAYSLLNF
ncbi:hypothetical protein C8P67_1082 [Flavobacterium aquicola]|uniref:Uncharacterized protein n=1 Tax=Flavobacterium aquicola TaxID=1682742 RepID=A0A3E0EJE2_9FLAO|nr:hypothetical protein C8P67_1082 [Flavobacterium aquicola]